MVPPDIPIGNPATRIAKLPDSTPDTSVAFDSPIAKSSSTVFILGTTIGVTPHRSVNLRWVASLGVKAMIGVIGRYLDTLLAVLPDSVKATIKLASNCLAV